VKEKSFTLVELLAVIFIIGILAGLLLPAIGRVRRDAQIKAQQVEIRAIEVALESFYSDFLQYPPDPNPDADDLGLGKDLRKVTDENDDHPWDPDESPSDPDRLTDPDSLRLGGNMDKASEVFYYYLCRRWSKTSDTDINGATIPEAAQYRILLQINPATADLEYVDVPGGNGSPYLTPKKDRIGDSDDDGLLELLDTWDEPYLYWNNADGITCLVEVEGNPENPFHSAPVDATTPAPGPPPPADYPNAEDDPDGVWHHPINEFTFDIYSFGPNRANNLGFNDINFGNAQVDDDDNDTPDDEDDVNNY